MATRQLDIVFENKLTYGQLGESKIAVWLRNQGRYVLPAYEKEIDNNKGPRLFCPKGDLVVPDMLSIFGSKVSWVEAKHKSVFTWYRIKNRWETGIDLRHYHHYLKVAEITPWPVWILFLHEKDREPKRPNEPWPCPTGLFGQRLNELTKTCRISTEWANGMVYWAHSSLIELASVREVNQIYAKFNPGYLL